MTRIGLVRRAILDERLPGFPGLPWAVLLLLVATAIRLAIEPWVHGVPFLTYFPAVLIISILLGWRWGTASLLSGAAVANYAFQPPLMAFALETKELLSTLGFVFSGALVVLAAEALRRAIKDLDRAAKRETELKLELQHRVNNNLAVVQSLAAQTARQEPDPRDFLPAFTARLLALREANRVLSGADWEASPLPQLAEAALKPFAPSGQIDLQGPACALPLASCVPLALALHELGTNATKHGALSTSDGRVAVGWSVEGSTCHFTWREQGGPPVRAPTRRGMGSRLLRPQNGLADLALDFDAAGLTCRITIEGARLL